MPREPVVLTGPRVVLSAPAEGDLDRVTVLCQDPAVAGWTTVPSPYSRADAEEFVLGLVVEGWADGRSCTWAIRLSDDGELVGMLGLDGIRDDEAEIGFWLAPKVRGLGVMTEAVSLAIDYAFAPEGGLGLQRLVWHAFVGNAASAAVARRAGFRFEGLRRLGGAQRGRRLDDWQAALLRDDPRTPANDWPDATFVQHDPVALP
ncbi:GNAT family N-acetyltransferase [Leifsonia sp. NPDC058248]|uniref:GNAT family N-acetyltransferase n=1 Tax=Leifsonia sp. NPDC058248 TaxID=3346402 RepID=UPI0036DECFB5